MEIISKIQNNRRTPLRILKQTTEFDIQHPIWSPRQQSPTSKMPSSIMSSSRHHWSSRSSPVSFSPSSPMSYNPWQPIDSSHLSVSSSNLTSSPQSRPAPRSPSKTLPISAAFEIMVAGEFRKVARKFFSSSKSLQWIKLFKAQLHENYINLELYFMDILCDDNNSITLF